MFPVTYTVSNNLILCEFIGMEIYLNNICAVRYVFVKLLWYDSWKRETQNDFVLRTFQTLKK